MVKANTIICGRCGHICYDAERGPVYALFAHRAWEHREIEELREAS